MSDLRNDAEILRMTIPIMAKYNIPVTPENYATWYNHMSGSLPDLSKKINELCKKKTKFDNKINKKLYNEFVSPCNTLKISEVHQSISGIISEVGTSLENAGQSAKDYGGTLSNLSEDISNTQDIKELKNIVQTLISATHEMRNNSQELREDFEKKNLEIDELREELTVAKKLATTDPLTGLNNRHALDEALESSISQSVKSGSPLCYLMTDIDHFKKVNDKYGHIVGDKVIRYIASILKNTVKNTGTAARYGGEEFALIIPGMKLESAKKLANSVRKKVEESKLVRADTKESIGKITVSIGLSEFTPGDTTQSLIERADQALYHAKNNGRNKVSTERVLPTSS